MGKLNIQGNLDIHNYLSATNTNLYLSSAATSYSIRFRAGDTEFLRGQISTSANGTTHGTISGLYLFGPTYGNTTADIATAGKLSIGDPGPQIIFNSYASLSDGQPLALIYSDNDSIATGNSLSLVSSESNCTFIAPTIKALTKFIGVLDGNASTATKLATARTIRTNLASTSAASFDGSANITPGVTGILGVTNGGTGRAELTSGYALIGNGTSAVSLRALTNNTAVGASGWSSTTGPYLITHNTLAYWNGCYSGTTSNLAYCSKGAFGDAAIKAVTTSVTSGSTALVTSGAVYSKCANYLPLSGGAMTGNISYANGSYTNQEMIKFITGSDSGAGIVIGGGGLAVFGSGESASHLVTAASLSGSAEETHITSDGTIYFHTNCQTIANRKTVSINASGAFSGTIAWGNVTGKPSSYKPASHSHSYVPLSGGSMSGQLSISINSSGTSPSTQHIILNGQNGSTAVANAPGLAMHIGNKSWSTLKFLSDGSWRFYNDRCNGYMPIYCSKTVISNYGSTLPSSGATGEVFFKI